MRTRGAQRASFDTIVAAGQFVPMIEQLGFIRNIDRFALERAVEELDDCTGVNLGFNILSAIAAPAPSTYSFALKVAAGSTKSIM